MGCVTSPDVTLLLERARAGEGDALEALLPVIYEELHTMAQRHMRRERSGHTLGATGLVHEAWLKLVDQRARDWQNRAHFLSIAAMAMRRVLVNHAEAARAAKRGGGRGRETLIDAPGEVSTDPLDVLALDEALNALAAEDERKARVVELRFFADLENAAVAAALGVTERTVERDWRMARAWLRQRLSGEANGAPGDAE